MSVTITPIVNADSFGTWLARTNQIATVISSNTVTVSNTLVGGFTYGNGTVIGQLGSNIVFIIDGLRGGNCTTSNTLSVTSNVIFKYNTSNLISVVSNATSSNVNFVVNTVNITGNVIAANTISVPGLYIDTALANTNINVGSNVSISTSRLFVGNSTVNTVISADGISTNGNLTVFKSAGFANTISANGGITSGGNGVFTGSLSVSGAANLQSSLGVAGSANVGGNLRIGGDLIVSGNMAFNAVFGGDLLPTQNAVYRLGNTGYRWESYFSSVNVIGANSNFQSGLLFIDTTNNRIGINNTAPTSALTVNGAIETNNSFKFPDGSIITSVSNTTTGATLQAVDSFIASTYRSADYTISVKDNNANGYQVSNILIIHNGTTSYLTEFGTMYTNNSLGTFTTDINTGSVRLLFTPVSTNTTLKIKKTILVA